MAEPTVLNTEQTTARENIYWVIGLVVGCVVLELVAEYALNTWAKSTPQNAPQNRWWLGGGIALYIAIAIVYGWSLMYGQVTIANAMWQCLALVFITIIGVAVFKDRPTLGQWVGLGIATVGFIVLVSGSKEFGSKTRRQAWFTPVEF